MVDATTIILTAMFTGIGVSIGNSFFEIFFKDYFKKIKKHKKKIQYNLIGYKRPWLAALLNFFIWGLGYFYVGKKRIIGVILFIVQLFIIGGFGLGQTTLKSIFESLSYSFLTVIIALYLSYDAYKIAREIKRIKETKK